MSVPETLEEAAALFRERNKAYGDNYVYFGKMLAVLFSKGLTLKTESDFARASNLFNIITKLSRYCKNFEKGGHEDSAMDSIVYWAIQKELDKLFEDTTKERSGKERRDQNEVLNKDGPLRRRGGDRRIMNGLKSDRILRGDR